MKAVAILLTIVGILALLCAGTEGVCCTSSLTLTYTMGVGSCGDVGGRVKKPSCQITICANGRARVGSYCGRGSCNIFGCACRNGCLAGDWQKTFLEENKQYNITITNAKWNK